MVSFAFLNLFCMHVQQREFGPQRGEVLCAVCVRPGWTQEHEVPNIASVAVVLPVQCGFLLQGLLMWQLAAGSSDIATSSMLGSSRGPADMIEIS